MFKLGLMSKNFLFPVFSISLFSGFHLFYPETSNVKVFYRKGIAALKIFTDGIEISESIEDDLKKDIYS